MCTSNNTEFSQVKYARHYDPTEVSGWRALVTAHILRQAFRLQGQPLQAMHKFDLSLEPYCLHAIAPIWKAEPKLQAPKKGLQVQGNIID